MDRSDATTSSGAQATNTIITTPTPSSHGAAAGQFTTPVLKRQRREGSDVSEPRFRLKRRQLILTSAELRQKEEKLQKLRLVSHYRQNHSLSELSELTLCWREAAQESLTGLQERLEERGQPTDMAQLLRHLGIDPCLVRYDPEEEVFQELAGM